MCRRNQGFTLIEMLLTVFLIGLVTSIAVLNVGRDQNDIAKLEARRFTALLNHLQDESALLGYPMGIEISETEGLYRFWQLEEDWIRIEQLEVLRERSLPEDVRIAVDLLRPSSKNNQPETSQSNSGDDQSASPKPPRNMLLVEPTGLIRPFVVSFSAEDLVVQVVLDNQQNPVISSVPR